MISLQSSMDSRGRKATSARYATAWLDHGVNPTNQEYEYAILVNQAPNAVRVMQYSCMFNYLFF